MRRLLLSIHIRKHEKCSSLSPKHCEIENKQLTKTWIENNISWTLESQELFLNRQNWSKIAFGISAKNSNYSKHLLKCVNLPQGTSGYDNEPLDPLWKIDESALCIVLLMKYACKVHQRPTNSWTTSHLFLSSVAVLHTSE